MRADYVKEYDEWPEMFTSDTFGRVRYPIIVERKFGQATKRVGEWEDKEKEKEKLNLGISSEGFHIWLDWPGHEKFQPLVVQLTKIVQATVEHGIVADNPSSWWEKLLNW